jgi:VWFA-related protein
MRLRYTGCCQRREVVVSVWSHRKARVGLPLAGAALLLALLAPRPSSLHAQDPQASRAGQAPAAGQDDQAPPQPTFRLEASYVRVDVYPTADGRPVADLTADDFELMEDGVPQRIEQFERVALTARTARDERRDPSTVAEGREQAADPRRRVFVIFLDTMHSTLGGSFQARQPLVNMLERLIGPEDLFAVMTPEMDARGIVFARRTEGFDAMLRDNWAWGRRDNIVKLDPEEQQLEYCFPENDPGTRCKGPRGEVIVQPPNAYQGVAAQLIQRKRELQVLDALDDLVGYLGTVREERKAVITVTQGWRIFRSKPELARLQECDRAPVGGRVGTGPDGRITTDRDAARAAGQGYATKAQCHQTAVQLALLDNWPRFSEVMERANRFNVTFYPFDTRGLAAFDRHIGMRDDRIRDDPGEWPNRDARVRDPAEHERWRRMGELERDRDALTQRLHSMRALAENTDGIAIVNTNDLDGGAQRIVDDLSMYYLLGYYSTNTQLDGKWRKITVRVKRPGVDVRARRGYRALQPEDMLTLTAAPAASGGAGEAAASAESGAFDAALASLAGVRPNLPWRAHAAWLFDHGAAGGRRGRVWVTAELDPATARDPGWAAGGTLAVSLASADGTPLAETQARLEPGARFVSTEVATDSAPASGDLLVRLRLRPAEGALPLTDTLRITVPPAATEAAAARLLRAGPATARRLVPTADPRFRRNERVRLELPLADAATGVSAELLDKSGAPLAAIPVQATLQPPDEQGVAWAFADVALAPLAAGDYAVRLSVTHSGGTTRSLTGIRVVP